jgi:GNAT superfamily N-acetyltransferase
MAKSSQCARTNKAGAKVGSSQRKDFLISTDKHRLDRELIHKFLTSCYWAEGIPKETVDRSIENSLCFGLYGNGQQVGFARVISDFATYAYIGDVFVVERFRGEGWGKLLMRSIMQHPDLRGLRRWGLVTRDAHRLYAQFGFQPVKSPERHMEIHDGTVYTRAAQSKARTKG